MVLPLLGLDTCDESGGIYSPRQFPFLYPFWCATEDRDDFIHFKTRRPSLRGNKTQADRPPDEKKKIFRHLSLSCPHLTSCWSAVDPRFESLDTLYFHLPGRPICLAGL